MRDSGSSGRSEPRCLAALPLLLCCFSGRLCLAAWSIYDGSSGKVAQSGCAGGRAVGAGLSSTQAGRRPLLYPALQHSHFKQSPPGCLLDPTAARRRMTTGRGGVHAQADRPTDGEIDSAVVTLATKRLHGLFGKHGWRGRPRPAGRAASISWRGFSCRWLLPPRPAALRRPESSTIFQERQGRSQGVPQPFRRME